MDYKELLEHSFVIENESNDNGEISRLEYLANHVFDFTTYDGGMSELFAKKAVEVSAAITGKTTLDYIKDTENYKWYLLMCNMPFFASRIEWGTSIRGAWWAPKLGKNISLQSCGLWDGDKQLADTLYFSIDDWRDFISSVIEFSSAEIEIQNGDK